MITLKNVLKGHEDTINGVSFTNSNQIISWSDDTTVRIWSLDGKLTAIISNHNTPVTHALYLTTGFLVSTGYDGLINIWDTKTNTSYKDLIKTATSFMGTVQWNDEHILSWDLKGNLSLWNILQGKEISILEEAVSLYYEFVSIPPFLLWSEKNKIITWGTLSLDFWDVFTGKCINSYLEHTDSIEGVKLLNNNRILTWSSDSTLKIWTDNGIVETTFISHEGALKDVLVLKNNTIISWDSNHIVHLWNSKTGVLQHSFSRHLSTIINIWVISDQLILSKSIDGHHYLWNKNSGEIKHSFQIFSYGEILINPSILLSWKDTTIILWNLETGDSISIDDAHTSPITKIILINEQHVLSWAEDAIMKIWHIG